MPTNPSQVASDRRHFATIGVTVPTKPAKPIRIVDDGDIGRMADAQHPVGPAATLRFTGGDFAVLGGDTHQTRAVIATI